MKHIGYWCWSKQNLEFSEKRFRETKKFWTGTDEGFEMSVQAHINRMKSEYDELNLPDPNNAINPTFWENLSKYSSSLDGLTKDSVVKYLEKGIVCASYMGSSSCRICNKSNGSHEMTDFTYIWPEGLAHYVEEHDVCLPISFLQHIKINMFPWRSIDATFDVEEWVDEMNLIEKMIKE